jgi:uncharacterized protein
VIAGSAPDGAHRSSYFCKLSRSAHAELIDQGKGGLGARMARALRQYSNRGAVLLGTDTPSLPSHLLAGSVALLRRVPVVIAPSLDGGYYLVGVRGVLPDIFKAITWSRGSVLSQTIARLSRDGIRYALGPAWYDIDRWSDVELLAAHLELLARPTRTPFRRGSRRPTASIPCPATATVLRRLGLLGRGR